MAVEEHLKFPEWVQALEELNIAWANLKETKAFSPHSDHAAEEGAVLAAMRRLNRISDEIDT